MPRHRRERTDRHRRLFEPSIPIVWADPPPPITEERHQANLARSAQIRTALHAYLNR